MNYNEFFKSESKFYIFALLNTEGETRSKLLKMTYTCYAKKEMAVKWYNNILEIIKEENNQEAEEKLKELYENMIF